MSQDNYTRTEKLFHQIALSGTMTSELFLDLEKSFFGNDLPNISEAQHVFVSGLARAGTTVLMRLIHETDQFASLTYRDMPLVMAPNLWQKLSSRGQKAGQAAERAHGDGMEVDFDSPEALEEVFWRTFSGDQYIQSDRLVPMQADADTLEAFRDYIGLTLKKYARGRYLSKNNNSILRLPSLLKAFPNATILVPFRHPAAHAASLLRQHERFLEVHDGDAFSKKYMTWLVHHEFGADHRRFDFGQDGKGRDSDPSQIDYWIDLWIEVYRYLEAQVKTLGGQAVFICYDDLTANPQVAKQRLSDRLNLDFSNSLELNPQTRLPNVETDNMSTAMALFENLRSQALTKL